MAKFTYIGDIALVFVDATDLSTGSTLLAVPGETYELDSNPDTSLFAPVKTKKIDDVAPAAESN
jgi:hypothetical protein